MPELVSPDQHASPERARRPRVLVFDVNETLSDMSPLADRFEEIGAPGHLATSWFAGLLRDGVALAVTGGSQPFSRIGEESLRILLGGVSLRVGLDDAVAHVMAGFGELRVHEDVPGGVRALAGLGIRLVTLSNGAASIAHRLLAEAGVRDAVEQVLSVEAAGIWKPAPAAYAYALERCSVDPQDAMLVAVHPWDTDGAARAGLGSAWVNRTGGAFPGYFTTPDLEARSLLDLAEQLR